MRLIPTKQLRKIVDISLAKHNITVVSSNTRRDCINLYSVPYGIRKIISEYKTKARRVDYKVSWQNKEDLIFALREISTVLELCGSSQNLLDKSYHGFWPHMNNTMISFYAFKE